MRFYYTQYEDLLYVELDGISKVPEFYTDDFYSRDIPIIKSIIAHQIKEKDFRLSSTIEYIETIKDTIPLKKCTTYLNKT